MNLSFFYAKLFGFYLVIMSIGMIFRPQLIHDLILRSNNNELTTLGIVCIIFGLAIVISHQIWKGWPIIITILGYWIVIKGIIVVFYPEIILKLANYAWEANNLHIVVGIDLVCGVILLICGYKGNYFSR
jgi:uncharacterized membrane protein